jgi:hypothetical protein
MKLVLSAFSLTRTGEGTWRVGLDLADRQAERRANVC